MKKHIKIFPVAPFFATALLLTAALLVSCDLFPDFFNTEEIPNKDPHTFYARNMVTGAFYQVTAEKLAEGSKCVIWAENGCGVTVEQAKAIADKYDKVIRPQIVDAFSKKQFYDDTAERTFADILEYADWLTDKDEKLTILLLDIQDGYDPKTNSAYTAGYFYGGDFYSTETIRHSNGRDMIYIDTYPGLQNLNEAYSTFAHELQHLINFATSRQMKKPWQDTWVDEGLSSQAEHIYIGGHPVQKCEWFRSDRNGTIAKGNNFFVWGNREENPLAIMDDYATVYMFFRWLYLQAGIDSIFRDMVTSAGYDHNIIVNLAKAGKINSDWDTWEKILRAWMTANYFPDDNIYGYKNDPDLHKYIVPKFASGMSISLYPGEGAYSRINNSFTLPAIGAGPNIRYVGMNNGVPYLSPPYTGEALLTFNANENTAAQQETGRLTGVTPSPVRAAAADVQKTGFSGPYVIDARDILGREWDRELPIESGPFFQGAEK